MTKKKAASKAKAPAKKDKPAKKSLPQGSAPAAKPSIQESQESAPPVTASSPETGPAKKLAKAQAVAGDADPAKTKVHDALEQAFKTVADILHTTAEDPKKHPRQLRWALKALDAAHVAAKNHVDRNV